MEKAGERGGSVVGYSASGKPIYESKQKLDAARKKGSGKKKIKDTGSDPKKKRLIEKLKAKMEQKKKEAKKQMKKSENMEKSMDMKKMMYDMKKCYDKGMDKDEVVSKMCKKYGCETDSAEKCYKGVTKMYKSIEDGLELVKSGDQSMEDLVKLAIKEGLKEVSSKESENEETVAKSENTEDNNEEVSEESTEEVVEEKEITFSNDLFKPFTLGATLKNTPEGTIIDNVKPSKMDYVQTEKDSHKETIEKREE